MSAPTAPSQLQSQPSGTPAAGFALGRLWKTGAVVAVIMVVLALVGVGLTTVRPATARQYWVWLVPVYGLLCVVTAWLRSRSDSSFGVAAVARQALHWLGVGGAVALDFYMRGVGEEAGVAVGFNALLLLAVGCFLAGVHLEWLFIPVGLLLALTLFCVVKASQYLWLILVVGAVLLAIVFAAVRLLGRSGGTPTPAAGGY